VLRKIIELSELSLLIFATIFFLSQFVMLAPPREEILAVVLPQATSRPAALYVLINAERERQHLKPLTISPKLETSATLKACDMRDRHYFNHIDPEGNPTWGWFDLAGYVYSEVGENIGRDLPSDVVAHQRFMASSKHRENILSPTYEEMGVARCGRYVVEHFGSGGIQ
jgi:uncharacterized protein YkwD